MAETKKTPANPGKPKADVKKPAAPKVKEIKTESAGSGNVETIKEEKKMVQQALGMVETRGLTIFNPLLATSAPLNPLLKPAAQTLLSSANS